jgi:hypothetical protein
MKDESLRSGYRVILRHAAWCLRGSERVEANPIHGGVVCDVLEAMCASAQRSVVEPCTLRFRTGYRQMENAETM